MTFDPNHEEHLRELQQELHRAHAITPGLMADVIARACPRLPLAILIAFVEARHRSFTAGEARPTSVPQIQPAQGYAICCDNFA